MAWRALLPNEPPRRWQALLLGAMLAGASTLARVALEPAIGSQQLPFISYFPALILAAALAGIIGGLSCLLLATIAAWILFLPSGAPPGWAVGSFWISGGLIIAVAAALAESVRELRRSRKHLNETQDKLRTLVGELAHRNRNALSVIMSIVSQSTRRAASVDEAERIINERLMALDRAQKVLLEAQGGFASLRALLDTAVAPFGAERFAIAESPDAEVAPELAAPLGLLFHEMATNALKYGALSTPDGNVRVNWIFGKGAAQLSWRELGGPTATEPARRGFGTRLLSTALTPHGGKVERRFEPEGVVYDLLIPGRPSGYEPEKFLDGSVARAASPQPGRLSKRALPKKLSKEVH